MFNDLLQESANSNKSTAGSEMLQLNSAFDVKEFSRYIQETNMTINDTIASYRSVMTEALKEAADDASGEQNSIEKVADSANKNIGQKILAALKQLWNWLVKMVDQGINFVMTIATSNQKFIEQVKPKVVEKHLTEEDMQKIRMNSYDYHPELINISAVKSAISGFDLVADLDSEYTEQSREAKDKHVKEIQSRTKEQKDAMLITLANELAGKAGVSVKDDWKKYKQELYSKLYGGEKKSVKTFNMKYFEVIEDYSKNAEEIKKTMSDLKDVLKSQINKVTKAVNDTQSGKEDKNFISGKIAYLNVIRAGISDVFGAIMELLHIKLKVIKRQVWDARQFCMFASRYKKATTQNEGAEIIVPFDPLFESVSMADECGLDDDKSSTVVTESSKYIF